ncbi:NAD(P)H-dependent oxidoreductase [Streptomyces sp. NPDC047967]|uniref:NADPH-dependent FMN reductase n=1 Tax=Streptomyces sp. NPDC047967 TaxID=3154924 RepID=UPI0033FCA8C2
MSPTAPPAPEYAHGTSGVLKNALEWMVGGGEIAAKPVALVSASTSTTGGGNARAWLAQTLTVMGAEVIPQVLRISQATRRIEDGRLTDGPTVAALRDLLDGLADAAATAREVGSPFARVDGALLS